MTISYAGYHTQLGDGWVAFDDAGVVRIGLPGRALPDGAVVTASLPAAVARLGERLSAAWRGGDVFEPDDDLAERAGTTPLVVEIYRTVSRIPAGATMTYGEVAAAVGRPGAARAVGAAMARNPFPPIIPCHRVVAADGSLGGYAGGLDQKRHLLAQEGRLTLALLDVGGRTDG